MAEGQHARTPEEPPELSNAAHQVLRALREQAEPMDGIALSSATRLPMEDVLEAVRELADAGLVQKVQPEPVHERFAVPA